MSLASAFSPNVDFNSAALDNGLAAMLRCSSFHGQRRVHENSSVEDVAVPVVWIVQGDQQADVAGEPSRAAGDRKRQAESPLATTAAVAELAEPASAQRRPTIGSPGDGWPEAVNIGHEDGVTRRPRRCRAEARRGRMTFVARGRPRAVRRSSRARRSLFVRHRLPRAPRTDRTDWPRSTHRSSEPAGTRFDPADSCRSRP